MIHDTWSVGKKSKKSYRLQITAEKRLVYEFKYVELKDMMQLIQVIKFHRRRYNAIEQNILDALPSP